MRPTPLVAASPLYYVESGANGEPVVLLHGLGCDSRSWEATRQRLSHSWRVFTPDLPGHGRSPKPGRDYDMRLYLTYISRWLDSLDLGPVHIVGHSLGGALAVGLALTRPDSIRSVTVVSSIRLIAHMPPKPVIRSFMMFGMSMLFGAPSPGAARRFLERGFGVPNPPAELVQYIQEGAATSRRAIVSTNRILNKPESVLWEHLPKVRQSALLLWGERDPLYPGQAKVAEVAGRMPNARLELLDCGHLPMFERPDQLHGLLEAHLSSNRAMAVK